MALPIIVLRLKSFHLLFPLLTASLFFNFSVQILWREFVGPAHLFCTGIWPTYRLAVAGSADHSQPNQLCPGRAMGQEVLESLMTDTEEKVMEGLASPIVFYMNN